MPHLEKPEFCSPEDYQRYFPTRLDASQLQPDSIYTLMVMLRAGKAATAPVEVHTLWQQQELTLVKATLLNTDLVQLPLKHDIVFNKQALWEPADARTISFGGSIATTGYIRDYDDGMGDFWKLVEQKAIPSQLQSK